MVASRRVKQRLGPLKHVLKPGDSVASKVVPARKHSIDRARHLARNFNSASERLD
jgi:hypothetical protein